MIGNSRLPLLRRRVLARLHALLGRNVVVNDFVQVLGQRALSVLETDDLLHAHHAVAVLIERGQRRKSDGDGARLAARHETSQAADSSPPSAAACRLVALRRGGHG
jgi:hypothetical protein